MRLLLCVVALLLCAVPAEADCPAGHKGYWRSWTIAKSPGEFPHLQLWNRGTADIIVDAFSVLPLEPQPAPILMEVGITGRGDANQVPSVSRTATVASGNSVLTGLPTTVGMDVGMWVLPRTDVGMPETTITAINSPTSLTVANAPAGNGSVALTFSWRQRLTHSISDLPFGAAFDGNGCDGTCNAQLDGPPSALSQHGQVRVQVSGAKWLIAQSYHFFTTQTMPPVTHFRGLVLPPGQGLTVRSANANLAVTSSWSWCEPIPQKSGSLPQPTYAAMLPKRKVPAKKSEPWWSFK